VRLLVIALAAAALILPSAALADAIGFVVAEDGTRSEVRVAGRDGLVISDSTRLRGLITEDDYVRGDFEVVADDDPVETVRRLDERIERNDRLRMPLTFLFAALVIAFALLRPAWAPRVILVALAANLWLSPALALAAGLAAVALPLGAACAAVLAVYCAALGLDAETVALSPFGPSQVSRFYGVNNLVETMLLAPALLGAALLGRAGIAVAALAFVTIGGSRFGADGGGVLVLAVAYLVLWWRLRGARPGRRHIALAIAALVLLVGLDAATGSSHVTEAVRDGPASLAGDLADRIERSISRTADSPGAIAVVLGSLAVLAGVIAKAPRTAVLVAFLAGVATSLVVNDTPSDVLGAGAAIAVALACYASGTAWVSSVRMRRAVLLLALLALTVGVAGCGGEEEQTATPETVVGSLPEQTQTETEGETEGETDESEAPEGDAAAGASIFSANGCGSCHTLEAAGSSGSVGPNLDEAQPDFETAYETITNGKGAMPAFEGQLSEQEIANVAAYVVESTS
jgi:mono/diheme cytochrome c family protein